MKRFSIFFVTLLVGALSIGALVSSHGSATAAKIYPTMGWTIHIDANKHFSEEHPGEIAHHFCRPVAGGWLECQIYDSDAANAHLVAVETIVPKKVWNTFEADEKALWHYHKTEIPKLKASMPDMTAAEAKKTVASIMETYGKIFILWDPVESKLPVGEPHVYVLK